MKHLATYLLLQLGGTPSPTKEQITESLQTVGVEVEEERLDKMMTELEGKDISALLEAGKEYLATFGGGGGGGGGGGDGSGGSGDAAAAEVVKEEEPQEEEMEMGGAVDMFGGGDAGGGDY